MLKWEKQIAVWRTKTLLGVYGGKNNMFFIIAVKYNGDNSLPYKETSSMQFHLKNQKDMKKYSLVCIQIWIRLIMIVLVIQFLLMGINIF